METGHVVDELRQMCRQYATADWDGYQASPVSSASVTHAVRFVESLPPHFPSPSLGAEPDGQITLEWYRTPRHTLSVSVSSEGDLHYAALVGRNRHYGTIAAGEPADAMLTLVNRVMET